VYRELNTNVTKLNGTTCCRTMAQKYVLAALLQPYSPAAGPGFG
jgi:hypothetical protein